VSKINIKQMVSCVDIGC